MTTSRLAVAVTGHANVTCKQASEVDEGVQTGDKVAERVHHQLQQRYPQKHPHARHQLMSDWNTQPLTACQGCCLLG
jgi:hypothetical protein